MFKFIKKKLRMTDHVILIDYDGLRTHAPVKQIAPDRWAANRYPHDNPECGWYTLNFDGTVYGEFTYVERWESVNGFFPFKGPW